MARDFKEKKAYKNWGVKQEPCVLSKVIQPATLLAYIKGMASFVHDFRNELCMIDRDAHARAHARACVCTYRM